MSKAKWVVLFLLALAVAVPSYAVELTLGGFPSYMRTRIRYFGNSTFISLLNFNQAQSLGFNSQEDNITFVDSRLRLTPQLVLSDSVTIRAQVDVIDNMIWGGTTSAALGGFNTVVNSSLTPGDRFRGALLLGVNGQPTNYGGFPGVTVGQAVDEVQFFNVRMAHMDIVLPHNLGFMRIGRQPFDWGLGILANGGWDPLSDLGFVLDRFLYLKSFPIYKGTFTFVFVSDRFTQGNSVSTGNGDGYDIGAVAIIYNQGPFTIGGYVFPYIHQENVGTICPGAPLGDGTSVAPPGDCGFGIDIKRATLYSGLVDYKTDFFRAVGEIQGIQGELSVDGAPNIDIDNNILVAGRLEFYPGWPVKIIAGEFGYAQGGNKGNNSIDGGNEGPGGLVFNPAYNIDNLLFKNMLPTIYQIEGSVINAFYARVWGTVKLLDHVTFTPQFIAAWNSETTNPLLAPDPITGQNFNVGRYLGSEIEGTFSIEVVQGVNFDLIGSLVINSSGLKDLLRQQAAAYVNQAGGDVVPSDFGSEDVAYAFQGRVLVYIDQFFK
jgi:hypothetical protein